MARHYCMNLSSRLGMFCLCTDSMIVIEREENAVRVSAFYSWHKANDLLGTKPALAAKKTKNPNVVKQQSKVACGSVSRSCTCTPMHAQAHRHMHTV